MTTTFRTPNIAVEVADDQLEPLRAELRELTRERHRESADWLLEQLGAWEDIDLAGMSSREVWTLLRALDHVRNLGELGRDLQRIRDAIAADGIIYAISVNGAERRDVFFSYSGAYAPGDRLVASRDHIHQVTDVVPRGDGEHTLLELVDWK